VHFPGYTSLIRVEPAAIAVMFVMMAPLQRNLARIPLVDTVGTAGAS